MTYQIIEETPEHSLRLEYMGNRHGGYWLELIDRVTGMVKIMKSHDRHMFKGVTINHVERWLEKQDWQPMYKARRI